LRLLGKLNNKKAGVAQLVEHPTCNRTAEGSIPFASKRKKMSRKKGHIPYMRKCDYCFGTFKKESPPQIYCCMQCRLFASCEIKSNGCWIYKKGKDLDGYGVISIKNKTDKAHQVAYLTFVGQIMKGMHVCHKCDNPSCINPVHLFLGTGRENMHDKIKKGRDRVKGEESVISKLTDDQVRSLRQDFINGIKYAQLGPKYNITPEQASNIVRRKVWKHLD
jgi:hypothetical protein